MKQIFPNPPIHTVTVLDNTIDLGSTHDCNLNGLRCRITFFATSMLVITTSTEETVNYCDIDPEWTMKLI